MDLYVIEEEQEDVPPPMQEAPPEVPVTSKSEMMEQAVKRETTAEV